MAPRSNNAPVDATATTRYDVDMHSRIARIRNHLGPVNECAAGRALARLTARTPWIRGWRPANQAEDENGIDAVVWTDAGPVPLQVKSSRRTAQKWRQMRRRKGKEIHTVVVVRDQDRDHEPTLDDRVLRAVVAGRWQTIVKKDMIGGGR